MYLIGVIEALKIMLGYLLLFVFLPSLFLRRKFKKEKLTKRFMIYVVFGNIYLSTLVYILAYLELLTRLNLVGSIVITGIIIYVLLNRKGLPERILNKKAQLRELFLGEYGFRVFFFERLQRTQAYFKELAKELFHGRKIEWLLFLLILIYAIYQYGINSVEFTMYLAPDEEVHLYWIQSLLQGDIYPSGVYPHVFHTALSGLIATYHFSAIRLIIYFGMTQNLLIMTMLYIGLREVLQSRYAALLGFMLYTILGVYLDEVTYRFQFTVPQEYGMMFLIPMALFLFAYIQKQKRSDLVFFVLALALAVGSHFYTGAIAVILALAIGLTYVYKIIKEKMLGKLILAGLLSAFIALAPLATGLAMGYELEQSFTWGTEVITGEIYSKTSEGIPKEDLPAEEEPSMTFPQFVNGAKADLERYVVYDIRTMYLLVGIILFSLLYHIGNRFYQKDDRESEYQIAFAVNSLLLLLLMLFKALNLPTIMEPKRLAIYFAYFSALFFAMPLEIGSRLLRKTTLRKSLPALSLGVLATSLYLVLSGNLLRPLPPLYYFQPTGTTRTDMKIMEEYEDFTWTVISPVNNISSIMNNGFHYELSNFILAQENWTSDQEIHIPSEHLFLYIEKRPIIEYGSLFYRGDDALDNRPEITREDALEDFTITTEDNYYYIEERTLLMAKAYAWAQEYQKYFPKEVDVYYEDSELIVYHIHQNVNALQNLSIDYQINSR